MARMPKLPIIAMLCITGSSIVVKLVIRRNQFQEELAFAAKERRRINQITRQMRQETSFVKTRSTNSDDPNYHRQEVTEGTMTNSISDYPYTVSLLNRDSRNREWHVCGGTLITQNIVLSAAHCRDYAKTAQIGHHKADHIQRRTQFRDVSEDHRRSSFQGGWKDTRYQRRTNTIELDDNAFIVHPMYDSETGENDFMLIMLPESIYDTPFPRLNSHAYVPNAYGNDKDKRLVVLGWGLTRDGDADSASEKLLKATLEYVNNYNCGWEYGAQHIKKNMLCAHSTEGRDACSGDSGGPLIMQHEDGPAQDLLVGVVSWGAVCGSRKYPGVYARLSSAYKWINDVVCTASPDSCEGMEITAFQGTGSPSQQPSPGPSNGKSQVSTIVTPTQSWCKDFHGRFYITKKHDKIRDCKWVGSSPNAPMLWYRCRWFKHYCPKTCSNCRKK